MAVWGPIFIPLCSLIVTKYNFLRVAKDDLEMNKATEKRLLLIIYLYTYVLRQNLIFLAVVLQPCPFFLL